jgi:hypothetical protein
MSEDRLEKAIEEMKNEPVDPEKIGIAQKRVRQILEGGKASVCGEFRSDFQDYLEEKLSGTRRLLLEDHLGRCPGCRTHLAEMKGERKVLAMPERRPSRWPRRAAWAAIAAMAICALYLGRSRIDAFLAPGGPIATVVSADGNIYRVPDGILKAGDAISRSDTVRTAPGAHARLRLADGSLVNINENTELSMQGAWSGHSVQLKRGDILVQAAKQRRGHLQVQTRDSLTSVKGTVFAVSSGLSGTLVSVIEGSVAVTHSGTDVLLNPGEQEATNPALERSVQQAISWSPDAETYIGMLASLVQVEKRIAEIPMPQLPAQSHLIQYMPSNMFVYGAAPNIGDNLNQAVAILEQQAAKNSGFSQWWDFGGGKELKLLIDRIQTIIPHLGSEIACGFSATLPGAPGIPVILAEVQPDRKSELEEAIRMLSGGTDSSLLPYYLDERLLVASNSLQNLEWLLANLGKGASGSFATEIAARYSSGAGWLIGADISSILALSGKAPEFMQAQQVKHLFFDQRTASGIPENEMTLTFNGPRMGLPSFIAENGSGGAAEYINGETLAAGYIATREPQQLFEELMAQASRLNPSIPDKMGQMEAGLGVDISYDLARAFGTEAAFSVESISTAGPAWTMAILVNDSLVLEESILKLVEACNKGLEIAGQTGRITYAQDADGQRTWTTVQMDGQPFAITWTYDRGYMVVSSDRGTALRAIATRDGGLPLVWSSAFQQQLPPSAGIHPSGFAWLNPKGAFQTLAALVPDSTVRVLIAERDPILVVIDAGTEQIRAVSHTRLSSVLTDLLLLQELGKTFTGQQN